MPIAGHLDSDAAARAVVDDPDATVHERTVAELALKRHAVTQRLAKKPRAKKDCCHKRARAKLSRDAAAMIEAERARTDDAA